MQRQVGTVGVADGQLALQVRCALAQSRVPDGDLVAAAHNIRRPGSLCIRAAEVRRIGDQQIRQHFVVNVAAESDHSGLIELHRRVRLAVVQGQLEALGRGERVDLVTHGIAVRERHRGADRDDQQVRSEGSIHLVHHGVHRRGPPALSIEGSRGDHGAESAWPSGRLNVDDECRGQDRARPASVASSAKGAGSPPCRAGGAT